MRKTIVVSAINFRSGGPLSILNDCLKYLDINLATSYRVIALVHDKSLLNNTKNIEYIEFPISIKSYIYRLYYEYVYFKKLSKKLKPYLWFSLHDMTPSVTTQVQAVYCHNPSPFYNINFKEFLLDPTFALFSWFYRYLYKINIRKNDFVIIQQEWMRKRFEKLYKTNDCIVAHPIIDIKIQDYNLKQTKSDKTIFFYPTFPRVFKNIEIICEAIKIINDSYSDMFEFIVTIDGSENKYAKMIYEQYKDLSNIKFIGLQSRDKVFSYYSLSDCLIFPSKLETWGLPISEYKVFKKSMLLSDLDYAHEALGQYTDVNFFDPNNAHELAEYMINIIEKRKLFNGNAFEEPKEYFTQSWEELFKILLGDKNHESN